MKKTYLQKLKFKKEYLQTFPGKYLLNIRLMIILLLAVVTVGVYSFLTTPQTLNPEVEIPFIIVNTVFPGAGPKEVESLITIPLEKEIKSVEGVTVFQSSSRDNVSVISVEFTSATAISEARERIQSAVDKVADLPTDAQTPQVRELDFENFPVITFSLSKKENTDDFASLMRLAQNLDDGLEEIEQVDRVEISGPDEREVHILIKPEKLLQTGLNPIQLSSLISNKLKSFPAGKVQTSQSSLSLTLDQPIAGLQDLRELNISTAKGRFRLGEICKISEQSKYGQTLSFWADKKNEAKRAVVFEVYKTTSAELEQTGLNVRSAIIDFMKGYEDSFETAMVQDYAQQIDDQFGDLQSNFGQTLFLVFASMLLLYGVKQALIASSAIPVSMLLVFASMQFFGISLSFVSIFALLIALGLFVDNAVVVIEAFTSYYRTGKFSALETSILVWKDYFIELFTINLLTVWAFLPLLITSGIIGEFVYPIPIIVSVAMIGSAGVVMFFTLPLMMIVTEFRLPKRVKVVLKILGFLGVLALFCLIIPKSILFIPTFALLLVFCVLAYSNRKKLIKEIKDPICDTSFYKDACKFFKRAFDKGFISLERLSNKYRRVIAHILQSKSARKKVMIIIVVFTLFSYLLVPLGLVENEFFPKSDQDEVYLQLSLPAGTKKEITKMEALKIMPEIKNIQEVEFVIMEVGKKTDAAFSITNPSESDAKFTLCLVDEKKRKRTSMEIASALRKQFENYNRGSVQIVEENSGPPAGADLQINLLGEDLSKLEEYASGVEEFLNNVEGVTNINRSIEKGPSRLVFKPNREKLAQYNISESEIGFWIRTLASGFTIDDIEIDGEELDIVLKISDGIIWPEDINKLQISTAGGNVPVGELGKVVLKPTPSLITRENGKRTLTISASVLSGYRSPEINIQLENFVRDEIEFEEGYEWETGGVNEEFESSTISILEAMVLSIILIVGTMVLLLGSFRNAFIVILVIPLAISGVFILFALTGTPLSFPALVGLLALFGIVIANSLMIVDKVKKNLEIGLEGREAIIDASASRLEPILLTTASQIVGLIPITLSDPLWRGMGGAIIAGMSFSGIIMLFFIPVVYFYLFCKNY